MKKRPWIFIPTLAVIILLITLLVLSSNSTPGWKAKLDAYLAYLRTIGEPSYALVTAVPAGNPAGFSAEMSAGSFSDSIALLSTPASNADYSAGLQPVPYPPDQLWCVLLADGPQQQVVYVALHNSLYNAEWLVHVPPDPWGSPALQSTLSNVGCAFE